MVADVVERGDVGMVESGDGAGFALPALIELGLDELKRHGAAQARVVGLIDHTHPALAERRKDLIGSETSASRQHHDALIDYILTLA